MQLEILGDPVWEMVNGSSRFIPHPIWVAESLDKVWAHAGHGEQIPILFHQRFKGRLIRAWQRARIDCQKYKINFVYGWSPRKKMNRPEASLSMHAYGIALDINPAQNKVGTRGNIPDKWVEAFKYEGFIWGGDWKTPDPMHFEIDLKGV